MFSISKKVLYPAAVVLIVISLFAAFQAQSDQSNPAPEVSSSSESDQPTSAPDLSPGQSSAQAASTFEVSVGPARQQCYGPFLRMCLVVDGRQSYHEIDGFTHEPGYEYVLRIEEYDAYPGQAVIPQDTPGRSGYRLIEEVSKVRASGEVVEATVAPTRVTCPGSEELCLLVNGVRQGGAISGFEFRPGYDHLIRYENYPDGSRRLLEVVSQTPAKGSVVEIRVDAGRVDCRENAPISDACIVVNGQPYYGNIEDFARGHEYEYRLRVERYDLMPGVSDPPPETSKYGYVLLEVLSEKQALSY